MKTILPILMLAVIVVCCGAWWKGRDADTATTTAPPSMLEVKARVLKVSEPPVPGAAEIYPDTTTYTLYKVLTVVDGAWEKTELLAVEWVQKDEEPMPAEEYQEGDEHHLVLIPLKVAEKKSPALKQAQFVDAIERYDLRPFWVSEHKEP